MQPIKKHNKYCRKSLWKINMQSSNQLTSHVFYDKKLTPIKAEMPQSQIGKNNKMLFHLITSFRRDKREQGHPS